MFSAMKKGLYITEHNINATNRNQASSTHHRLSGDRNIPPPGIPRRGVYLEPVIHYPAWYFF